MTRTKKKKKLNFKQYPGNCHLIVIFLKLLPTNCFSICAQLPH